VNITQLLKSAAVLLIAAGAWIALEGSPVGAQMSGIDAIKSFDKDGDGTIDLNEAKTAGAALFDKLDAGRHGVLTNKELGDRVKLWQQALPSPNPFKMFAAEGNITRDEYLALIETRFKLADQEHDGKLDAKELESEAGQALLKLLQ